MTIEINAVKFNRKESLLRWLVLALSSLSAVS